MLGLLATSEREHEAYVGSEDLAWENHGRTLRPEVRGWNLNADADLRKRFLPLPGHRAPKMNVDVNSDGRRPSALRGPVHARSHRRYVLFGHESADFMLRFNGAALRRLRLQSARIGSLGPPPPHGVTVKSP